MVAVICGVFVSGDSFGRKRYPDNYSGKEAFYVERDRLHGPVRVVRCFRFLPQWQRLDGVHGRAFATATKT